MVYASFFCKVHLRFVRQLNLFEATSAVAVVIIVHSVAPVDGHHSGQWDQITNLWHSRCRWYTSSWRNVTLANYKCANTPAKCCLTTLGSAKRSFSNYVQPWLRLPNWHHHAAAEVFTLTLESGLLGSKRIHSVILQADRWKLANVVPAPKVHPPKDIRSDLRPISLTPTLANFRGCLEFGVHWRQTWQRLTWSTKTPTHSECTNQYDTPLVGPLDMPEYCLSITPKPLITWIVQYCLTN